MTHEETKEEFLKHYDAHGDALFRFAYAKTSSREMAEDFVQETFMRYWKELQKGKEIRYEKSFLYRVLRNMIIDWYRKKKTLSLDQHEENTGLVSGSDSHQDIFDQAEVERVFQILDTLDEKHREVVVMRYVDGMKPQEIAEILEESVNAVSTRITRARQKVEHILEHGQA